MPIDLYISNITGTPVYQIYVCDCSDTNCYQIPPLSGVTIPPPFQFSVPNELSNETCFLLRIIDSLGCVIEQQIFLGSGSTLWQFIPPLPGSPTPTPTPTLTEFYIPPTPSVTATLTTTPTQTKSSTPTPTPSRSFGAQLQNVVFVHIPNL